MKRLIISLTLITGITYFISCRNAENKADREEETTITTTERDTVEKIEDKPAPSTTGTTKPKPDSADTKPNNEILSKIDQHLVSTPQIPTTGSLANATVTIKNTLADITFQKAIVQVTVLDAAGKEIKSDFYTIQNIEPGDTETIKIPNTPRGTSLVVKVVKVKSNELTKGEMVLTGSHFAPK